MSVFDNPAFADHERVITCFDAESGLRAIIAIHDRTLGPAAGGCRMWPYADATAALTDVLRLSAAMSYKNALAGLPLGGGKSVIIGTARQDKNEKLLLAFGRCVQELAGSYWTAEDVGIGIDDVEVMARATQFVFGRQHAGLRTGDPSPFTALGCFHGMRAAVRHRLGRKDLSGLRVAVQGVGNVGYELCKLLHAAGAHLTISDIDAVAVERASVEFQARVADPGAIFGEEADVLAPCALGGVLNDANIPKLRATVIAGVANNQLGEPHHDGELARRGILYAPDYVVNAGGMHNASGDILGHYDPQRVRDRIAGIHDLCLEIFQRADHESRPPAEVADAMARERIRAGRGHGAV